MVLVYSNEITPRIEYIFKLIFARILGIEVEFTSNSSNFQKSEQAKINYSFEKFGNEFYIKPHPLLFYKALIEPTINSVWYEGQKYFFESSTDSDLPFDVFAASFYLVTRYEEYLETEKDEFGRYPAEKSILFKYNLLEKPVVNIWSLMLADKLRGKYPFLNITKKKFSFISTIDVDNAWAFKNKGFFRISGAILHAFLIGKFGELALRIKVLTGKKMDPYDTYAYLNAVFKGNEEKVKYFFLVGNYGHYDKNISYKKSQLRKLIKKTSTKYEVGIHPSFSSVKKGGEDKVLQEINRLENIIHKEIKISRQHYLGLMMPRSYRRLIRAGISEDYTMGYSSKPGFRAGICTPYCFYDLKKEKATNLLIVPFQVMDGTLRHYLKLSPRDAIEVTEKLMEEVKKVGGAFVSIWHNETVTDEGIWKGYKEVFERTNELGFKWANEN